MLTVSELTQEPMLKERLVYDGKTGRRIDVTILLNPLRAMYRVGVEGEQESYLFSDINKAVEKYNALPESKMDLMSLSKEIINENREAYEELAK